MKLSILTAKAKILGIQDAEVEDIMIFIKHHDNPNDFNVNKCGYCKFYKECKLMASEGRTINSDGCNVFKYKHNQEYE